MHNDDDRTDSATATDGRLMLLIPADGAPEAHSSIDYLELWNVVWRGKWWIIGGTVAFAALSIAYALLATQWFRAEAVLVPAANNQELSGDMGGLAGFARLAGVQIGDRGDSTEALAVLRSREFAREFIDDYELIPVLFADRWDAESKRFEGDDPELWPDWRDAVRYFQNVVLRVYENPRNQLVTLSVEWKDRAAAAEWANALVERLNDRMRQRALEAAEKNVAFLRTELEGTSVLTLQQAISGRLDNELQTLMFARGTKEFSFKVVDGATPPKWRSRPKRTMLVVVATLGGGLLSLLAVLVCNGAMRNYERRAVKTRTSAS